MNEVSRSEIAGRIKFSDAERIRLAMLGHELASPATLARLERTGEQLDITNRYQKIVFHPDQLVDLFLTLFIESFVHPPARLIIDFDPSDIELHGQQEQRFYHGYYRHHCYLPMYVFCGQHPLLTCLRSSNRDGADGTVECSPRSLNASVAPSPMFT